MPGLSATEKLAIIENRIRRIDQRMVEAEMEVNIYLAVGITDDEYHDAARDMKQLPYIRQMLVELYNKYQAEL